MHQLEPGSAWLGIGMGMPSCISSPLGLLQTAVYLLVLAWAIRACVSRGSWRQVRESACVISVTWFLIFRFMAGYEGDNVFDAACQLLAHLPSRVLFSREGTWT